MDFSKLKVQIKPHQVSLLLATPRSLALLFTGAAAYIGFVDPHVRNSLVHTRSKLRHWATMYTISLKVMASLSILGSIAGVVAYFKTKQKTWLIGSGVLFSTFPWTYFTMCKTNNQLVEADRTIAYGEELKEMTSSDKYKLVQKMQTWVKKHRVRIGIALVAAGIYYLAQLKSTQEMNVGLNVK